METSSPPRIPLTTILNYLNGCLPLAGLAGPHIHLVVTLSVSIVATLLKFRANKRAFEGLANLIHTMVKTVVRDVQLLQRSLSGKLARYIDEFIAVLQRTENFVNENLLPRTAFRRLLAIAEDPFKIQDYRRQIKAALHQFQMQVQMEMYERIENIENIVINLQQRDLAPPYTIPDDIRRIAEEYFDRLLPVLGVFTVFQEPPTIRQIACVLAVEENSVQEVWGPISSYLDGLDSDERARCLKFLETRRDGKSSLDPSKYHNLVAQWCLTEPKAAANDIFYASDFWVHHVCCASPSLELRDALTKSELPLDSDFRDDLLDIISWLKIRPPTSHVKFLLAPRKSIRTNKNGRICWRLIEKHPANNQNRFRYWREVRKRGE
ncbi:hypothetical protein C8R44DRAFT_929601 [Mycena epipterygia]|nr:hypothetical protein C8R44DRAFT_929601 [Mycena epipterygia]